jgi:protein-tyrosine-phosphatase
VTSVADRRPDPRTAALPELVDPLGRSDSFFRQTAEQVDELSRRLVRQLFGAQPKP